MSAFKCNTANKKTNNMLQGLNQALAAVKSENCNQVRQALNNIPHIQRITRAMQDNRVVHQIKIQESRIKTFMAEMQRTKDETKKQMFQGMVDRARVQLLELESQLAVEKSRLEAQSVSDSVDELHTFSDKMIETINQNRECFEDNEELTQHAIASLTGIAGLLFSTTSVGMGLMAVSKITQKLFSIGKEEGEKNATEAVKLGIGLRCALQNVNSIHCENLKNANLLDKLTEASSTCVDCAGKSAMSETGDVVAEISSITKLSTKASESKQSRFIRSFRKGTPSPADRLKNIGNFLQNIDEGFFSEVVVDFDEDEIKGYIGSIGSVNQAYQDIERHSASKNKEALKKAKKDFYTQFTNLKDSDFFDPHELTAFILEYSRFQQKELSSAGGKGINKDAVFYSNLEIMYDVLALSGSKEQQKAQKDVIRDSKDMSEAALEDFSDSFGRYLKQAVANDDISSHSKNELCIRLLGLPDIQDMEEHCTGTVVSDSGKAICFNQFANKPHSERVCAYENFLRSLDDSADSVFAKKFSSKKCAATARKDDRSPSSDGDKKRKKSCKRCKDCRIWLGVEICPTEPHNNSR